MKNYKASFDKNPWFEKSLELYGDDDNMAIIGLGNIGSWFALYAGKAGFSATLYDDDIIEARNVGSQLPGPNHLGQTKVDAIVDICDNITAENNFLPISSLYDEDSDDYPIIISCVDSIGARKMIFNKWKAQDHPVLFIDGGTYLEKVQICVVPGKDNIYGIDFKKACDDYYKAKLETEDTGFPDVPCGEKSTAFVGAAVAAKMFANLINHAYNEKMGASIRDLDKNVIIALDDNVDSKNFYT